MTVWAVNADFFPDSNVGASETAAWVVSAGLHPTAATTGTLKGLRPASVAINGVASVTASATKVKNLFATLAAEAIVYVNASQFRPPRPAGYTPPFVLPRVRTLLSPTPHLSVNPPRRGQR